MYVYLDVRSIDLYVVCRRGSWAITPAYDSSPIPPANNNVRYFNSSFPKYVRLWSRRRYTRRNTTVIAYPHDAEPDVFLISGLLQYNRGRLSGGHLVGLVLKCSCARLDRGGQRAIDPNVDGAVALVSPPHSHSHLEDVLRFVQHEGQLADLYHRKGWSARPA